MKNQFLTTVFIAMALLQFACPKATAQTRATYTSTDGFWVLVTNEHVKNETTVQYYNNDKQLIYEEQVHEQKMNLNRLKTWRCLKKGLDSALMAWNQQKQGQYNKNWVAVIFRH
jgi:hypothetical protein